MIVQNPVEVNEETLREMAREVRNGISRIYLHWTAGHYGQVFDDYHLCVDRDGTVYVNCKTLAAYKTHTWMRSHNSIGIALCCGYDARCWCPSHVEACRAEAAYVDGDDVDRDCALIDLGPEPPTAVQIEVLAKIVAILCEELRLDIDDYHVMTHCEAAFKDGYGPGDGDPDMRWDLWFLPADPCYKLLYPGGELLREKANFYRNEMEEEREEALQAA